MHTPLPYTFYLQPTLELSRSLIGKKLVHDTAEGRCEGIIVETEAYMGPDDQAAHSYNNRKTARTEVMFGKPATIYTYTMHTHVLLNIVCSPEHIPHAILIRAVEPTEVCIPLLTQRRKKAKKTVDLTNGPGKLCQAFNITMDMNGGTVLTPPLYVTEGRTAKEIVASKRIGIENSGEAKDYLWRFYEKDNPFVSRRNKEI